MGIFPSKDGTLRRKTTTGRDLPQDLLSNHLRVKNFENEEGLKIKL